MLYLHRNDGTARTELSLLKLCRVVTELNEVKSQGVAVNTVVAIERGEGNPQLATMLTILDTLGLQIDINIKRLDYETV